ncbi:Ssk22p [Rhizophagus irregularis DAOM 197198w]|uniref:Ssk22p n=1 Tax=Rhizophagus irregularis (strain DAOM 197198w) TaxID=1432141 RepID=A0A015JRX6_RHIIW|nr:Ssk22p [Rhizophagus irregularis DAOM 197198w]
MSKLKVKKCNECKKKRNFMNEIHRICHQCYKAKSAVLKHISNHDYNYRKAKLEFVPYGRFKDIEFIAEGGFSKIYKATWIDGPISNKWNEEKQEFDRCGRMIVVLKELNNSNNIDSKELNELKIFYNFILKNMTTNDDYNFINKYFGITQNSVNQNFMIITNYYESGDLTHFITKNFFNISWKIKLKKLFDMIGGLKDLHNSNIIHQDYHSGNIFSKETKGKYKTSAITGDFGISKSAIESSDDDNEVYGIIPYVAPEIFQGQKYTKASDIYSYGMIMWELMTGRRPFWDKSHDTNLIIEICDGLRPPIVTNAPEGYIELMQECWHSDPNKRPNAHEICDIFTRYGSKLYYQNESYNQTKIINSPDIGPITTNNPGDIYKSRPLSTMIKSVKFTKSLKSQSIIPEFGKRKFNNNLIENNNEDNVKKSKLYENKNDGTPGTSKKHPENVHIYSL